MTIIPGADDGARAARGASPASRPSAPSQTTTRAAAIELSELTKVYPGGHRALDEISLAVEGGEIFGFLGPNGSGKTTTVRVLVTLLQPTSGRASVAGVDVARRPQEARRLIGYSGQSTGVDDDLTTVENLALQGILHGLRHGEAWARAAEVLEAASLTAVAGTRAGRLSGGLRRRLDLAQAIVHRPAVLFLDEPTTGLDPQARLALWDQLRSLSQEQGTTVFLTTQYLEEADRACDRVGIIDGGHLVRLGRPRALKDEVGEGRLAVTLAHDIDQERAAALLQGRPWVTGVERASPLVVHVRDARAGVALLVRALDEAGIEAIGIDQAQATLDDVFLHLTGRRPRAEAPVVGATSGIFAAAHGRRRT